MGAASSSGQEGSSKEEQENTETNEEQKKLRDQLAIKAIRNEHSQWDKNSRELKGVLDQAQDHKNTKDCKFVGDLCKAMEEGQEGHDKIMKIESMYIMKKDLDDDAVNQGGSGL